MRRRVAREPAIVFGGGINGLGITRNLGCAGVRIYCVTERIDPVFFSRRCYRHVILPKCRERSNLVRSFLKDFSRRTTSRPVIFATNDTDTLMLSTLASNMKDDYHFVMPKKEVAETLVVKRKFYESLIQKSVSHPRVLFPTSFESIEELKQEVHYPVFIRPSISPEFNAVFKKKGFIANTERELDYYYKLASQHGIDVMFQEIVYGPDTNLYGISGAFDKKSEPLALFGYHRLRGWPVMFGNNSLMESVVLSELSNLKSILVNYLQSLGYYGIMEAEFKRDIRDNQFKLLEVNARSWWQNSFPTKCGQNIILKAYLDAIGQKIKPSEEYVVGIKWVDALGDLRSSIQNGGIMGLKWLKSLSGIRDFAYFDISDPLPFLSRPLCVAATGACARLT